ncbi:MAG: hypothetical protein Q8P41_21575 [Pseudomonadota bacterium]|nr:hypothetical protein [Pseudomonadota bacterium]
MLDSILGKSDWADLKDFLTPTVFDVLPPRAAQRQVTELLAARLRPGEARRARAALVLPGLRVAEDRAPGPERVEQLDVTTRARRGSRVLKLYFYQLLRHDAALLDLRADRFHEEGEGTAWRPGWLHVRWDPTFLAGLRDLYGGYYTGDTPRFDAAIDRLSLRPARDVFLAHFGGGDQREVRFERATFVHTFHDAFLACRDAPGGSAPLHGNFLALGLYLATLYEHLERLGLPFDVRAAYTAASDADAGGAPDAPPGGDAGGAPGAAAWK